MPTVGVVVEGGLGNQMFQLAAAYAHAQAHGAELTIKETKDYEDGRAMYWESYLRAWQSFLAPTLPDDLIYWKQPGNGAQTWASPPAPDPCGGIRLRGYFQSSKYFRSQAARIKELMRPSADLFEQVKSKYTDLLEIKGRVIVVHARRGDYCRNLQMASFHGPLPVDYYVRTVKDMASLVKDPYFLFVCEEPEFWNSVFMKLGDLINTENTYVLNESNEIHTLVLLQQFKNFIIANSSFSWWAAWLSSANHVFAPRAWFGPTGLKDWHDIYESDWVLY